MDRPFSQACENNKDPILSVLKNVFLQPMDVLEVGSGTGQHAAHMARHLPHLTWYTSDRLENHPGIRAWTEDACLPNLRGPLDLDVTQEAWPLTKAQGAFSANTAHIMAWPMVEDMFKGIGKILLAEGHFCLYGPFNYQGRFTSDSNERFDGWLKRQDPQQGIRDFEAIDALASENNLEFIADHAMPANNRILVWRKRPSI